jgi:hypothetical protein
MCGSAKWDRCSADLRQSSHSAGRDSAIYPQQSLSDDVAARLRSEEDNRRVEIVRGARFVSAECARKAS